MYRYSKENASFISGNNNNGRVRKQDILHIIINVCHQQP